MGGRGVLEGLFRHHSGQVSPGLRSEGQDRRRQAKIERKHFPGRGTQAKPYFGNDLDRLKSQGGLSTVAKGRAVREGDRGPGGELLL